MIISSASPQQIIDHFHHGYHDQEVLCALLATSQRDRNKIARLIQNFFDLDAVLGKRVAFLILHPDASGRLGIDRGFGEYASFPGYVFVPNSDRAEPDYSLRNSPLFRDVSDSGETLRAEVSRESARAMAQVVPDFIDLLCVDANELPVLSILVRGRSEGIIIPLPKNWQQEDLLTYFAELRKIAERPIARERDFPGTLSHRIEILENGLREVVAKQARLARSLQQIARRYSATVEDQKRLSEFLFAERFTETAFFDLLSNLSFARNERYLRDPQISKAQRIGTRIEQVRATLQTEVLDQGTLDSIAETARDLHRFRMESAELIARIRNARSISIPTSRAPVLERIARIASYVNLTGDLGEKVTWVVSKVSEILRR